MQRTAYRNILHTTAGKQSDPRMLILDDISEVASRCEKNRVYKRVVGGREFVIAPLTETKCYRQRSSSRPPVVLPLVMNLSGPLCHEEKAGASTAYFFPMGSKVAESPVIRKGFVLIDTNKLIERAASKINMFRFNSWKEPDGAFLVQNFPANPKDWVPMALVPNVTENIYLGLKRAFGPEFPYMKVAMARFLGLPVQSTWADDEIEHTLRLCNLIARNILIYSIASNSIKVPLEFHGDERSARAVNKLISRITEMAYGDPFFTISENERMMAIDPRYAVHGANFTRDGFLRSAMTLAGKLEPLCTDPMIHMRLIGSNAAQWRDAAKKVLDDALVFLGAVMVPGSREFFERASSIEVFSRENFPEFLGHWKRDFRCD